MDFSLDDLQEILLRWPTSEDIPKNVTDKLLDRICQILRSSQSNSLGIENHADLQPLIRQALLRASMSSGEKKRLRVPSDNNWPDKKSWSDHGFEALEVGSSALLLSALEWHPEWLGGGESGVFFDAFSDESVRRNNPCQIDPFIGDSTGFKSYSSQGQREAIRAAFLIPEGDTLLVNLPTGSGKSLVGQAPTLVHNQDGHLTIFVVPTVALALDQARAMQKLFMRQNPSRTSWPLAWYGGLSQEHRLEIRKRLRNGTQRILFTSPEALTTSLLRTVLVCARLGMLRYLVIDEAHLITQWGDEFRPTFQALAGVRQSMLKLAPRGFRTLLMSATFTEDTVETLATLFGPSDRVQMVSAVHLRPEPQYWFYGADSVEDKQLRVLEALRYAPRPFILYVTKREEVSKWEHLLRAVGGLCRIATFHGKTPDSERLRIIDEWANDQLDGIVATSAFGVGLDKADVRTVIHATIPETLDRYYQEVGRGGRDGKPSISLLVYEKSDWILPERLAKPRIISEELGYNRWRAMWQSRQETSEVDLWEIDIDAVHQRLSGGSEYNVNWNMRTLILMARAGLLALEIQDNAEDQNEDPTEDASSLLAAMANVRVRILEDGHLRPEAWETAISVSRRNTLKAAERNLQMMRQLLPINSGGGEQVGREVGETLAELYRIRSQKWPVHVSHACGGCPRDRFNANTPIYYSGPVTIPVARVVLSSFESWREKVPWLDPAFVYVFYNETLDPESNCLEIMQLTSWLIQSCGVREVWANPESAIVQHSDWKQMYRRVRDKVLLHRSPAESDMEPYSPLARLTVLDSHSSPRLFREVQMLQRPFHIVILPLGMPDPENSHRCLSEVTADGIRLENLIQEINR